MQINSLSAICQPLSALAFKKQRVTILLVLIWSTSFILSLPKTFILSAALVLNDRTLFPCVAEDVFWDLTSCVPFWSNTSGLIYTTIKAVLLYFLPLVIMILVYRNIIKTLWRTNVSGILADNHEEIPCIVYCLPNISRSHFTVSLLMI